MTQDTPILTAIEAAYWLRLMDDSDDPADGVRRLNAFVRAGRLRPIRGTRPRVYWRDELLRFAADETAAFGASDSETEGNGP